MRNTIFLLCLLFSFYSCNRQDKNRELPCERLYIVEFNWICPEEFEEFEENESLFRVVGFSELDKSFNLHYVHRATSSYDQYYTSNILIADSLKDKISSIINEYQTDTTFLYNGRGFYDGYPNIIIFQKNNNDFTRIFFHPEFLPQDLLFLYNILYENRQELVWKGQYTELFKIFENIIMTESDAFTPPPPPELRSTIHFTPPIVKKKK